MPTPTEVYLTARELVGSPYQHQGRKKDIGIDCIGVPIYVANRLGLGNFDVFDYPRSPDGTMQTLIAEVCSNEVLQPGVLLLFRISDTAQHCGIVSLYQDGAECTGQRTAWGDPKLPPRLGLIHAWDIAEKVVEHRLTKDWINKVVGCYGLPGVHYDG